MPHVKNFTQIALAALVMSAAFYHTSARAATGPWAKTLGVQARLVTAIQATDSTTTIASGLEVILDKGWDTYWRSPGDAGAPPELDWSESKNVSSVSMLWPAPRRTEIFGLQTVGYIGAVTFPLEIKLETPGEPVALRAKVDMLVCKDICKPVSFILSLDLPTGTAVIDSPTAAALTQAERLVPGDGTLSGLTVAGIDTVVDGETPAVIVRIVSKVLLKTPDIFIEAAGWNFGKPRFAMSPDFLSATAYLDVTSGPDAVGLSGKKAIVTVIDGDRSLETVILLGGEQSGVMARLAAALPFLGTAFAGGLVLNLMPCVLPVLAMKLFAVLGQTGRPRRKVRIAFLASAAGILCSMLALAAGLSGLKAAGMAVGWGIQFQQPGFLVCVVAVLLVFATAMGGGFEIGLPGKLVNTLSKVGGDGLVGSFLAGAFATLIATPCSAPFVGTAVAFALARGPEETTVIFGALGVGMAMPYIAVAAFPGFAAALPKPGKWMVNLRRSLALVLALTAAWLLYVLAGQVPPWAAITATGALATMVAIIRFRDRLGHVSATAGAVTCLIWALATTGLASPSIAVTGTAGWIAFDAGAIGRDVSEGKVVFVDVTASWCATCAANRAIVLGHGAVAEALRKQGVVPMMADWTRPNAAISTYLARNGRFGIPFNAVYGPGAPYGIVLSELLTSDAVLLALDRAARPALPPPSP